MMFSRVWYRTLQFWNAIQARPTPETIEPARSFLSPALMNLFSSMAPGEQVHSLKVFNKLLESGENDPDLLTAALLHDVGKSRYPLRVWERILIVLGQALAPGLAARWGEWVEDERQAPRQGRLARAWKKPFQVAAQHPLWGAQMALRAGASPAAAALIQQHQLKLESAHLSPAGRLLAALQAADDEN
jgi:hypothetical protein